MTDVPTHISESLGRAHARLDRHESRIQHQERHEAGMSEWRAYTSEKLEKIESGIQWIFRLVAGALITGIIAFIISGGLNVAP